MLNRLEISKKIEEYRETHKESEKLSDSQIISILSDQGKIKLTEAQKNSIFLKGTNNQNNDGFVVQKNSKSQTIKFQSGRKIVIQNGTTTYYPENKIELNKEYFEKQEGQIDIKPSGRYSVTKDGYTKYFAADGTELKESYFKQVESNDIKVKSIDGKTYNFNKTLENRINNVSINLQKAENSNGFIGSSWNGFKNLTGIGDSSDEVREQQKSEKKLFQQFNNNVKRRPEIFKKLTGADYTPENIEKFIKGEIKLKSEQALNDYKEGQDMAVDVGADIVSGIAAVGIYTAAVAAAPFSGGASIAVGVAAAGASAAAIKTGLKAADAVSGGREYTLKDVGHDAVTGAFSGIIAPVTGGIGGAAGKTIATKVGVQAVKQVGKKATQETAKGGLKQAVKTALTNPTGYEYAGGNIAKRALASGTEMATDGALGGAVDNAFRTAYDGGGVDEVLQAGVEGFVGGAIMSPLIGGGMKAAGKAGHKLGSGSRYIDNFAAKKIVEDTPGFKNSEWVKANIDKLLDECQNPYYDFGNIAERAGDRIKHPDLPTHKINILTTFLSNPKLYDNPKLQEKFRISLRYVHDAKSAKNLIDGFNHYLEHTEYHNNPNIKENLEGILLNARMSIENKAKVFNLIANDSKINETKQPFLNYRNTKLDLFISADDGVDIDLAFKILHDTNDNNGTILHRILDPGDECYSEITALYNKFKDKPEYDEILNALIFRYKKGSKQILDIMLNDKDFPKELMPGIISRYNAVPDETKLFIEEICAQKDFPKEQIEPIIRSTLGLFEGGWSKRGAIILTNFAKDLVNNTKIPAEQVPEIVSLVNTEKAISFVKDICHNFETKGLYVEQVLPAVKNGNLSVENVAKINKMLPKERVINFKDEELAVVSGAYNFLGKKHIHELSKPQKRTLLNLLLQNKKAAENGELTGIKDLIPFFPVNTEEYTRIMKDLSRSMNLSVETLDDNMIELFNKNLINLAEIIKTKSGSKNIDLAITHQEFINNINDLLKDLPKEEALKVQSQFGFKIENGKLTGYPQCNSEARVDVNELVRRYTKNNSVKISGNPELEEVLNNLIKICPEIMNQIDSSNQFSKTLNSIQNMAKRPEFNKLNAEDKTVLMLAALLNNVDKSINSRMDTAFDAYFISQKFNLSDEAAQKLYSIVELSDAPERFMNTSKKATRKMVGVQELIGQQREDTFDLIAAKLKEGNTFELAKLLYSSQYEQGFTRNFDKILGDRILQIKANDFTLPQTPAETYQKFAQSRTITRGNANYSVKMVNADDIPDLHAFTHAPDVGYITGGSRDANFANFDFFKLANDDKIICTCYVSNDHYGPVKQFKNGFIFDVDNTKQYVGYGTDIWSIGKNIPDIVIEYFRDRGLASAKNRGAKFEQRAYISEQLKALLYPEDTSFSGKIKKWIDNLFSPKQGLSKPDLQYIQRLENIKTQLGNKPFTIQNIETIDPEFAQAYKTFLNSDKSILVDSYHNELLVSNPKITASFTSDIDKIPEEYLIKAQEEDLPIIVFKTED